MGAGGDPPGPQAPWWRGLGWGRAQGAPGPLVAPLAAPFCLYLALVRKPSRGEPFFPIPSLFHRRRRFKIGAVRRPCRGALLEGGPTSGSFSIAMDVSRMTREYSTLDHGSMISSYVMFSILPCASLLSHHELPYMIEAHM